MFQLQSVQYSTACYITKHGPVKKLYEDLGNTLATVIKVVNFIKSRPCNKRLFAQLCENEALQTLLLHTEVRWLSRGHMLVRFMEL